MITQNINLRKKIDALDATAFQKKVWKALLEIPPATVRSYSWIAKKIGSPQACRAVGNALNKNPLAPEVPCHRVVRSDGSLGGYAKGVQVKKRLLKKEGIVSSRARRA